MTKRSERKNTKNDEKDRQRKRKEKEKLKRKRVKERQREKRKKSRLRHFLGVVFSVGLKEWRTVGLAMGIRGGMDEKLSSRSIVRKGDLIQ